MQLEGLIVGFALLLIYMYLYLQQGGTPLYFASQGGHSEVVDLLLERGAQVNKVQHCDVSMQCIITSQATMWIASSFLELM